MWKRSMTRFDDEGRRLVEFSDRVEVRCPACSGRALVSRPEVGSPARIVCRSCPYAVSFDETGWLGAMHGHVRRRCDGCGQWLERRFDGPRPPREAHLICSCGWRGKEAVTMDREVSGPIDPVFGLELWFTAPFKGETVWAYNVEHLRFLRAYLAADLRQRTPNQNSSLTSRLPRWMKAAKNRSALVALIDEMEATAGD
jgi:hypothetical protein